MSKISFPPWFGEFGWEVATWAPYCRRIAEDYDEIIVTSFADTQPLYADFCTEFRSHGEKNRSLNYPKHYRIKGKYYRYGNMRRADFKFDVIFHNRGIRRKSSINYKYFEQVHKIIKHKWQTPMNFACVGGAEDNLVGNYADLRGLPLNELMDYIAAARCVVGVSSGLMHLAAFCGTDIVVWGDRRTYFGETLEKRYKETWNPFGVRVGWIDADDFQPEPEKIIERIKELI